MNIATQVTEAVVLFASPNKEGFTSLALSAVLETLPPQINVKTIDISKSQILPCIDCKVCMEKADNCPFNDDGMGNLLEIIKSSQLVIVATPIYFNGTPAKFKAIIDRLQQLFAKKNLSNNDMLTNKRIGVLITTQGSSDSFAPKALHSVFSQVFKTLYVDFIEHIVVTQTDTRPSLCLDEMQLTNITQAVTNYVK